MKKKYVTPEMEITKFEAEDVITTSFVDGGELGDVGTDNNIQDNPYYSDY